MIYLTGCTHFGHANIIKLAGRRFNNVHEMNETLIQRWNETVTPEDTVYHHGDFSYWRGKQEGQRIDPNIYLSRLNGNIILIQGNHDDEGWGRDLIEIKHNGIKVVMFHYPIEEWNGWWKKSIHTHCHTHSKIAKSAVRRYNVGVDANDFRPVSIDHVMKRLGVDK